MVIYITPDKCIYTKEKAPEKALYQNSLDEEKWNKQIYYEERRAGDEKYGVGHHAVLPGDARHLPGPGAGMGGARGLQNITTKRAITVTMNWEKSPRLYLALDPTVVLTGYMLWAELLPGMSQAAGNQQEGVHLQ